MSGEITEAGPAPGGEALVVQVECRTTRSATRGRRHPVTIRPDWSVDTPHDLAAERVAAALGAYCSCLELVDSVVPALREGTQLLARSAFPALVHHGPRGWGVAPVDGCPCRQRLWPGPAPAAEHARSARHLAVRHSAPRARLARLLTDVEEAYGAAEVPPRPRGEHAALVREPGGVAELWRAGVHPARVAQWWTRAGLGEPLPVRFYLGLAFGGTPPDWVFTTLARCPDPDVAVWLAWGAGLADPEDPDACAEWLQLGVPRPLVEGLVRAGVTRASVRLVAEGSWLPVRTVAVRVAHWVRAGCTPGAEEFALLERYGLADYRPSAPALDELCAELGVTPEPTRTQAGVMLALAGSRRSVGALVQAGARTPQQLAELLDEPLRRPGTEAG